MDTLVHMHRKPHKQSNKYNPVSFLSPNQFFSLFPSPSLPYYFSLRTPLNQRLSKASHCFPELAETTDLLSPSAPRVLSRSLKPSR